MATRLRTVAAHLECEPVGRAAGPVVFSATPAAPPSQWAAADWAQMKHLDGFYLDGPRGRVSGRIEGREYSLETRGARVSFSGKGFELSFDEGDPLGTLDGHAQDEVDLTWWRILSWIRDGVYGDALSYPALLAAQSE